jgi:sterol desaturase/sphingolipid hydroxylase (fatty acid hydroxylase superfamily)
VTTLGHAWREFLRRRSPWLIGAAACLLVVVRAALGSPTWRDVAAAAALLAIYPFGEWAIHVYLLHLRPFRWRGRRVELATARAHREHHERPNDLTMVLLAPVEVALLVLVAIPVVVGAGGLLVGAVAGGVGARPLLSAALAGTVMVGVYEWCHFLIHTAYRPRSRVYRQIWRAHRLHHFKNEHYWHGITSTIADRVLGTFPDQREVPRSKTARTLAAD